jgi:hypothetical protein
MTEEKKKPETRTVIDKNKHGIRRETTYPQKPSKPYRRDK